MKLDFGYFPKSLCLSGRDWAVSTLPDLQAKIALVNDEAHVRKGWYYPGIQRWQSVCSGEVTSEPFTHRVFGLPKTHQLELRSSDDPEQLKFLIWTLSFFTGMRLTTLPQGFLDATPIEPASLVDFLYFGSLERAVEMGQFCLRGNAASPGRAKRMTSAIHALFLAQYPRLMEFEKFTWLYAALDACFSILTDRKAPPDRTGHAGKISWMCGHLQIPVPEWALLQSGAKSNAFTSAIADLRNFALHEALYAGEPLGFAGTLETQPNLPLEMRNLLCRIIAAIFGVTDAEYLTTSVGIYGRLALRA